MRTLASALALAFLVAFILPVPAAAQTAVRPTITKISPDTVVAGQYPVGGAALEVDVSGTGFTAKTTANLADGMSLKIDFVSATQVKVYLPATLLQAQLRRTIILTNAPGLTASTPFPISARVALAVATPAPTPKPTPAPTPVPTVAPTPVPTPKPTPAPTVAPTPAPTPKPTCPPPGAVSLPSAPGLTIGVANPGPGNALANCSNPNPVTLSPTNGVPYVSTIAPNSAPVGAVFALTVLGNNFSGSSVVNFGSVGLTPISSSATSLTVAVPASAMTQPGNLSVSVFNPAPGGGSSASAAFTVTGTNNPVPAVSSVSPTSLAAGSGAKTVTVAGSGFIASTSASLGGVPGAVSGNAITFNLPAAQTATPGVMSGIIINPSPGGGTASFSVNVLNGVPTVSTFAPNNAQAGSPAMSIQVSGSNFGAGSTITFAGTPIPTTFVSASALSGQLPASFLQASGNFPVAVTNPAPGGGSAAGPGMFSITTALPTLSAVNPAQIQSFGGTSAVSVTLTGTGFAGNTTAASGSTTLPAVYSSSTSMTVTIPASLLQRAGPLPITVSNPPPGGGTSGVINLSIANPIPTLTSVSPTSLLSSQTSAVLAVGGTLFTPSAVVSLGGVALTTTFVSSTQLTAAVAAPLPLGKPNVTVTNPTPGGGTSNALTITISGQLPTIAAVTPAGVASGQSITVTGTNFGPGSIVLMNATSIPTNAASTTQLSATIPAGAAPGSASIAVQNPATSTTAVQTSTATTIQIVNPAPAVASVLPSVLSSSAASGTFTVTGTGFTSNSVVALNGANLATTFVSGSSLTATWVAPLPSGTATLTVTTPGPGGGASGLVVLTVVPAPTIAAISPQTVGVGKATAITITGTNFVSGSVVLLNGTPLPGVTNSATKMTAECPAFSGPDTVRITVQNPATGIVPAQTSNAVSLVVTSG